MQESDLSSFSSQSSLNSDLAIKPQNLSHAQAKSLCSRLLSTASSHLQEEYPDTVKYMAQSLQKVLSRSRIIISPDEYYQARSAPPENLQDTNSSQETKNWQTQKKIMERRVSELERRLVVESQRGESSVSSMGPLVQDMIRCVNRVRKDDDKIAQQLLEATSLPMILKYEAPNVVIDKFSENTQSIQASERELRQDVRELESVLTTFYSTVIH